MQNTSKLLRAITAVFVRRIIRRVAYIAFILIVLLGGAVTYLAVRVDVLWLIAWIIFGPLIVIGCVLLFAAWFTSGALQPKKLSRRESKDIYNFTTRLLDVISRAKIPLPLLVLSVIKSVLLRRDAHVLNRTINESKELSREFIRLRDSMSS